MKNIIIVSSARDCYIDILHDDADPELWFVRRWKTYFETKKHVSTNRFTDKQQALTFAQTMKRENGR